MKRVLLSSVLVLIIISNLLTSCDKPAEPIPSPSAPEVTLTSGYSQQELEEAVDTAGGGCDIGTLTITDNKDGTYTVECRNGEHTATATGNIKVIEKPPTRVPPKLHSVMCQFNVPPDQIVECGYIEVPEDRSQPDSPTIKIHFAVFKSKNENPAPDPVVYLEGGPGGHALESMSYVFERFSPFIEDRDLIVFDQRGTGYSEPSLFCSELVDLRDETLNQNLSPAESSAMYHQALIECHNRLVDEGVNLAAYNSAENAADLNDLRLALGYQEWNLFGISYGAKLALTAMRDFPEGIRSVILDSAYTPQASLYAQIPTNLDRALTVLFEGCTAHPACNQSYPELETAFWELVDQLNESPITFPVRHPISGEMYDVLINGDNLIDLLYKSLYSTEIIRLLPKLVFEIQNGNYCTLSTLMGSQIAHTEHISRGMYYSVQCNEEISFNTPEELNEAYNAYPELQSIFYDLSDTNTGICATCRKWEAGEADPVENEPVYCDIPTLILAGEYDPITPPSWGSLAAETLSNSYYYEFPGVGHGASVSGERCPLNIALAFLDDPTVEPIVTCMSNMKGPRFASSIPDPVLLVPFTDDVHSISSVVPLGWECVAPGLYIRSRLGLVRLFYQRIPYALSTFYLSSIFEEMFDLEEAPESTCKRRVGGRTWYLYECEYMGFLIDMAYMTEEGNSALVILQSTPDERDFYYEEVLMPAIEAFTPIDW